MPQDGRCGFLTAPLAAIQVQNLSSIVGRGLCAPPFLVLSGNGRAQRPAPTIHGEKLVTKSLHTRIVAYRHSINGILL